MSFLVQALPCLPLAKLFRLIDFCFITDMLFLRTRSELQKKRKKKITQSFKRSIFQSPLQNKWTPCEFHKYKHCRNPQGGHIDKAENGAKGAESIHSYIKAINNTYKINDILGACSYYLVSW